VSLEDECRQLNSADHDLRLGLRTYIELNWEREAILERIEELYDEVTE
jgi:hypothetical protein